MKRNKIFAWMAAAMAFAACTNNDITSDTRYDDDNVVTIGTVTRAGESSTTSPAPSPFLLTNVTQRENVGYDYEATYKYDSSNSTWTAQDNAKIMWYGSGKNVFQATYPCKTNSGKVQINNDFNKFVIPGYQDGRYDSIPDWMRATATIKRNNVALDLNFEHMLSKVTVEIDYSNITLDGNTVTSARVSKIFTRVQYCEAVTDADGKVTINPYKKTEYNTDGLYVWTTAQSDADNKKTSTTAIVAPGAYSKIAKVSVSYDGGSEEIVLYLPNSYTLEAGKHYTFTLSNAAITHDAATISSVSVKPWTEGTISSSKPAEFIPYVTFTSNEEVKFKMTTEEYTISGLEYSVDNEEWQTIPSNGMSEGVTFGGSNGSNLRLRGKNPNGTATDFVESAKISFDSDYRDAKVACTGDIRTLLDWENYKTVDTSNARFCYLFNYCKQLTSAPELPATTLADDCYYSMFEGCTSLTTAPELPATTLADGCYLSMFEGCTSLTTAPGLPATTLADNCYFCMFEGCTSLTTAPELPVTTLANSCYTCMFNDCKSLTTAPELPATKLAWQCYCRMFEGCILLETAPELPATTLANSCYSNMFNGCTSLTTAPKLKATTLASNCYTSMFEGCTSLTTAPELPATTLASNCYYQMFNNCTSLTNAPALPATTLEESCYYSMFNGCTSLTTAPELPATKLASECCYSMFNGCTSLTTAPALPATTLASKCYYQMFNDCTSLTTAPELKADTLAYYCYQSMFEGCSNLKSVTMLATNGFDKSYCLYLWLKDAGTKVSSRTLKVVNKDAYNAIVGKNYLPTEWKAGPSGATILNKDGNDITSDITSSSTTP